MHLIAAPGTEDGLRLAIGEAHRRGKDDELVKVSGLLDKVPYKWEDFLNLPVIGSEVSRIKTRERAGRPLGEKDFVAGLETALGRRLAPQKPAPKPEKK